MKPFKVNIVTPEKVAYEAEAVSVILPGSLGYLGIWANHAPLVTGLEPGVVTIRPHLMAFLDEGARPDAEVRLVARYLRTSFLIRWMCPRPSALTSQPSSK
jgi:hypothetical protein